MKIIKHKDVPFANEKVIEAVLNRRPLKDCVINYTGDLDDLTAVVEPFGKCNLLGEIREGYELIGYFEE